MRSDTPRRKAHPFDLLEAVFLAQMTVSFHRKRPAVFVACPLARSRHVHAAFNAGRDVEMPERVMAVIRETEFPARRRQTLLCAGNPHNEIAGGGRTLRVQPGE